MATFNYIALDAQGQQTTGTIQASDEAGAIQNLRTQNLYPTQVVEEGKKELVTGAEKNDPKAKAKSSAKKGKKQIKLKTKGAVKVKPAQRMIFTRQLATLIGAGLPLLRSLTVLGKQETNPGMKHTLDTLADSIQGGATFSQGLSQFPAIFDKLYVNMVRAGELGGVLEVVLERLAEYMEKAEKLKKKVIGAMVYPLIVMVLAIGIMTFLMMFVVPKFKKMFATSGDELPWLSTFVFNFSENMLKANLFFFGDLNIIIPNIVVLFGIIIGIFLALKAYRRSEKGKEVTDRIMTKTPLIGSLIEKTAIARFSRTLGTLVTSGVPILQALNIARETSGNIIYANAIGEIHDAVKEGEPIVTPMMSSGVFPPIVVSMVDVGEETGQLPDMLIKVADVYEEEVDNAVTAMTAVLEPLMIVGLALMVGTIVMALFMPLIAMIENLQ